MIKKKKDENPHCKCLLHPDTLSCSWTTAKHSYSLVFAPLKSQWTAGRINCDEPRQGCQRETIRCCLHPSSAVGRTERRELCSARGPGGHGRARGMQGWIWAGPEGCMDGSGITWCCNALGVRARMTSGSRATSDLLTMAPAELLSPFPW